MRLHPNARAAIIAHLQEGMPHIVVRNGMFLDRLSAFVCLFKADESLPKAGPLHKATLEFVGEYPLVEFCSDILSTELHKREYVADDARERLVEIEGYQDVDALARRLIDAFESLPWKYSLALKLEPGTLPPLPGGAARIQVTDAISLVQSDLLHAEQFPLDTPDKATKDRIFGRGGLLALPVDPKWDENAPYFRVLVKS
jgi:hypothetical protein